MSTYVYIISYYTCYVWHILSHCAYFIVCFFSLRSANETCKNNQPFETQISTPERSSSRTDSGLRLLGNPIRVFKGQTCCHWQKHMIIWGVPKLMGFPNNHWVFLLKMISTRGVKWGYHHLRKHPYMIQTGNISPATNKPTPRDLLSFNEAFKLPGISMSVCRFFCLKLKATFQERGRPSATNSLHVAIILYEGSLPEDVVKTVFLYDRYTKSKLTLPLSETFDNTTV